MAAGKSTVAQALAETLPRAAHVRGDLFRRMIVSGREEYAPGAGDEARAQLRLRAPRIEAVAAREAERGKTGYGGAWTIEALHARTPRIGLRLDTTELTVRQTVEEILAERQRARVF
ncbi:hypothetical protein [Streptomyces africanus]|uniref:hypothetical protein n=1 Tax=Streptomyces africanus TaxID=231024 RepID=UPI000A3AEDD9|nr:hypothetical protein [Streptomyces africanus]